MDLDLAKRAGALIKSQTQAINDRAQELKRSGRDLIDLGAGEPRFREPESVRSAGISAIESGFTGYTEVGGFPDLEKAIRERYEKVFGLDNHGWKAMATDGAKTALFEIGQLLYDEGDEVVIPRPYWVSYPTQVKLAGADPVFVAGSAENNYLPTAEEIEPEIGPDTVAILINSPGNPSGGVYTENQGEKLVELVKANDLFLISDECYDGFVYGQDRYWSLATAGYDRGLVVGSTSKNFAMTGWRLGYILGEKKYISELEKLQSHLTSSPSAISQKAAESALRRELSLSRELRVEFEQKRDVLAEGLASLPGIKCSPPPGSFYLFPDISVLLEELGREPSDDTDFAGTLLEEAGVVTVPGSAFGKPGHLRLAYLPDIDRLEEAVVRLEEAVNGLL
ncbi:pyridoxal phosphate-dependent aminotransferase [Candidatus Bipolaricaulota bacterium]|nr:pyridoxal phosphate-dependent aminotransferase [Candidatus Bipolaricaulota bacterium]